VTVREYFDKRRDHTGRAMLANSCWLDEHNGLLRLNTPTGVEIVSPEEDFAVIYEALLGLRGDARRTDPSVELDESRSQNSSYADISNTSGGVVDSHQLKPILWILAVPASAVAYYFAIALPADNEARLRLEREKYEDEQRRRKGEESRVLEEASERQRLLDRCLESADQAYWTYVKLNGTEFKGGEVRAPANIWNTADKRKNDERDACFKRYPAR
jgi:hypothetical protein